MSIRPDMIGQRYELGARLGRGGMGEVREATDLRLSRVVAIKVLRADLAEQNQLRERFEREARAAARINHPNVVAIYDIGEEDGVPFIVMERLPGNTLATEIASGRLGQERACVLGAEILSALSTAHQLGVIHRDIKPANILLDRESRAKVADFGIAKLAQEDTHTTMGIVFGTAAYLAPERLAGHIATPASDLYAVGVLLFEALVGRPPFRGDTPLALAESISRGASEPLAELRTRVDPAVVDVLERAMQPNPDDRFASASEMAVALAAASDFAEAVLADDPTIATPIVTADTDQTRAMPTTASAASQATVRSPVEPVEKHTTATRPSSRRGRLKWAIAGVVVAALIVVGVVVATRDSDSGAPAQRTPVPTGSIPAPLSQAIDDLDRAVTP